MTFTPHPIVMTTLAEQRRSELLAQAERDRLAKLAANNAGAGRLQQCPDLVAAVAVVLVLALLLTGTAAAEDSSSQAQQGFAPATASVAVQELAEDEPDTNTVQKVGEAAN